MDRFARDYFLSRVRSRRFCLYPTPHAGFPRERFADAGKSWLPLAELQQRLLIGATMGLAIGGKFQIAGTTTDQRDGGNSFGGRVYVT